LNKTARKLLKPTAMSVIVPYAVPKGNREVRAYTLPSGNVRGKGAASALWRVISSPCTPDDGRSCPPTQTNPMRFGCALRMALPFRDLPRQSVPAPTPGRSVSPLHHAPDRTCGDPAGAFAPPRRRTRPLATRRRLPRQEAFLPLDPDQPCAGWTRARVFAALDPALRDISSPRPPTGVSPPARAERFVVRSRPGAQPLNPLSV